MSVAAAATLAGCGDSGDGTGEGVSLDPVRERVTVDVDDIQEGGTLNFGQPAAIDSFDPAYSTTADATNGYGPLYESLITQDAAGTVYPWLAETWELQEIQDIDRTAYGEYMVPAETDEDGNLLADEQILIRDQEAGEVLTVEEAPDAVADGTYGMRYRAELHEGVQFHNGEEMTAENVAGSYRIRENSPLSAQTFDSFLFAEAVEEYTVDIYAQVPDAEGDSQLPIEVYPTEHIEEYPDTGADPRNDLTPIGTGPMEFEEYEPEEFVRLGAFGDYWLDDAGLDTLEWWDGPDGFPTSPVVDEVNISIVRDNATRAAALNNGEIDLTYGLSTDTYGDYIESEDFRLSVTESGAYDFMQFPVTVDPWDSAKLRRGINKLVPRANIVENIFNGFREPAWTPLPALAAEKGTVDYDAMTEDLRPQTEQDVEEGTALVEEVIEERGVETPIQSTIETNSSNDERVRTAQLVAQIMTDTGLFDIDVETFEFTTLVGRIMGSEYYERGNIVLIGLSGTFNPGSFYDAVNSIDNFRQCCNFNRVDTPELDELQTEARFSVEAVEDLDFRRETYDEIWRGLIEQVPNVYTVFGTVVSALSGDLVGHNSYPFTSSVLSYGLHAPEDEQVAYLDRG